MCVKLIDNYFENDKIQSFRNNNNFKFEILTNLNFYNLDIEIGFGDIKWKDIFIILEYKILNNEILYPSLIKQLINNNLETIKNKENIILILRNIIFSIVYN